MDSTPQENSDGKNRIPPQGNGCTAHLYFAFMIAFDVWETLPPSGSSIRSMLPGRMYRVDYLPARFNCISLVVFTLIIL